MIAQQPNKQKQTKTPQLIENPSPTSSHNTNKQQQKKSKKNKQQIEPNSSSSSLSTLSNTIGQQEKDLKSNQNIDDHKKSNANNNGNKKPKSSVNSDQLGKENVKQSPRPKSVNINAKESEFNNRPMYPLPIIDRSSFSYEYTPEYSFENINELIKNGKLENASKIMNLVLNPSIECLCYALNINQKINNVKKVTEIGARIDNLIGVKSKGKKIKLNYEWKRIWPYLDYLIDETFKNSSIVEREIEFNLKSSKCESYTKEDEHQVDHFWTWKEKYFSQLRYPFGIGSGRNNLLTIYISLSNYTKKENEARELDFHFFRGKLSEEHINPSTFYNLISRVGLTKEDLFNGKHGYKDLIRVFPYKVEIPNSVDLSHHVEKYINDKLEKTSQPWVVFVLSFASDFTLKTDIVNYYNEYNIYPSGTIVETTENRLYYCFANNRQKIIDLHKLSVEEANQKVLELIQERYDYRDREFIIITGKGNHVNENGSSGVLLDVIGKLLKKHPLVESSKLLEGKYNVKLKQKPFGFMEKEMMEITKIAYNKVRE